MASLSLKISIVGHNVIKTMAFEPTMIVYDACRIIREKIPEALNAGNPNVFGLFLKDDDPKKGVWLENGRTLEYYLLRSGDLLEYRSKQRILRVRMLDMSVKTLQVDDSHSISQLMVTICAKIGIANHEEYSLVRELTDEEKEKTMTLKREKTYARDQKRLEEMKRKLHTDDELNWLDHSKTLREQGIEDAETLLLRRKFFFSDQNVDARDPVQLNLLYVQSRDAILNGTHPVNQEEAIKFGGFQCQIQFGDHVDSKHKPGFLDLKEFLPKEYVKIKNIEKKIFAEHRKLIGLTEIEAKAKYTQLCRSLKTYGITFFLVKEKMKGKNKLVPRLLGITKEAVVRVDEKTKEMLKTWPLTTVRRWAASPNSFTLDFGDYSDSYYSVQTTEGEQISQLIAGYIDIILKKRKARDHFGIEGDEESTMLEDSVSPAKATIIQHQTAKTGTVTSGNVAIPAILRAGEHGDKSISTGTMQSAMYSQVSNQAHNAHTPPTGQNMQVHGLGTAQRALLSTISDSMSVMESAQSDLRSSANLPHIGDDAASQKWKENELDFNKQKVNAQLAAMNAATAQLVTLTSGGPEDTDYTAVGSAIHAISSNMGELSKDIRLLAALQDDDAESQNLLSAAKRLADAFTDMLKCVHPDSKEPRQNLLTAASKIGEASNDVMRSVVVNETVPSENVEMDKAFQDTLLGLAKAVANATAALVLKAKGVAGKCEDQQMQNKVISNATQCALSTSQLVACTKVVAPTVHSPACQEQLVNAAKLVAKSVEGIVDHAQQACTDEKMLQELGAAATAVTLALNDLLQHVKQGTAGPQSATAVDTILSATDRLFHSMGDAPEMVKQARVLAQATSQLVNAIKGQAESHPDTDMQKRLLAAAKQLADATSNLVEAAKGCASNPNDNNSQHVLVKAAEELKSATNTAAANALKKRLGSSLRNAAQQAAAASTQMINASKDAGKTNRNAASQQHLIVQCDDCALQIPKLIQCLRQSSNNPDDPAAQQMLIEACNELMNPASKMIAASKATGPTISDQAAAMALAYSAKNLSNALAELRTAASKSQEACGSLELDGAISQIRTLGNELNDMRLSVEEGKLSQIPGETAETSALQVGAISKTVGSSMAQLLTASVQGNENYTGIAARDTANSLRTLVKAVHGVAACSNDKKLQQSIIESAYDVMEKSEHLIEGSKWALTNNDSQESNRRLAEVAKAVSNALNNCVNCLPGQRDVDAAIKSIGASSQKLQSGEFPATDKTYQEVQMQLNNSAVNLNQAACEIVTHSRGAPKQLSTSANRFSHAYDDFIDSGLTMAGVTKDQDVQAQVVSSLRHTSVVSSKLLLAAKSVSADPNAPNAKNLLAQAARSVTESINGLINICMTSAPGQKECDNALRQMQMMRNVLDNPNEPVNDATYFDCLDGVTDRTKALAESMTGISTHSKMGQMEEFCGSVKRFAAAVCGLTENAAQAAYLIGISDPQSEPGRPGLVDQSQFARANQAIQVACQSLTNPGSTKQEVLSAATVVAKHTSSLCNTCRVASSKTSNPVAKRHFVQSAKDVANSTANLVRAIKELDSDFSNENREKCATAAKPLLKAVDELNTFASSPEFASIPARISPEARRGQEPISQAGRQMLDGACNMIQAAKQLAVNPKDPPTYMLYSNHSKSVSVAIKKLVTSIKDKAPGQKECDDACEKINKASRALDQASLAAVGQSLECKDENTLQGYQEMTMNSAREILEHIEEIQKSAKGEAEKLGYMVTTVGNYFEPLADGAIGTASKMSNSKHQMLLLDQSKSVTEAGMQFITASKEGAGNPKAIQTHQNIDEAAESITEVLRDLIDTLEQAASETGNVTSMIDGLSKGIARVDESTQLAEGYSFVDYQTNMVRFAKQIARTAQEMVVKGSHNVAELGPLTSEITRDYQLLSSDTRGAVAATSNNDVAMRIKTTVQELGNSIIDLVKDAGNLQSSPGDGFARKDLNDHAKMTAERVSYVLAALQAGSRGTQACINAASTISGILGDLDTTIMFATAGTLHADGSDIFQDHRESILKTAKSLVEDTKTLVAGAASNQEQLASAAQSAVRTITTLSDVVKKGAAALGCEQPDAQVMLINAVRDVTSALGDLISSTKNASGKTVQDPSMTSLKDSAKIMVTNVTSLLKTVKTVEDEAARGSRAMESTIEALSQEIKNYEQNTNFEASASAEDLVNATKPMTKATALAVAAANSCQQEDIMAAANVGRKAIFDLMFVCKAAAQSADSKEAKAKTLHIGREVAILYKELLEHVMITLYNPNQQNKNQIAVISKRVATLTTEVIHLAEIIKESDERSHSAPLQIKNFQANLLKYSEWMFRRYASESQIRKAPDRFSKIARDSSLQWSDWMDPDDPTVVAENELLGAANSIEAAARKLASLKPRIKAKEADDSLNFDDQILEAAKSIASATAALVKAASAAQKELVLQGKVQPTFNKENSDDDSQWSQGLISAARFVATATHSLCEAANAMVQGHASEEKLISSAKQVASSTAQLLVACKVKASQNSQSMRRLQAAGNAVKRATDSLVHAAQQSKDNYEEVSVLTINRRMVGGMAQIIMAQEEILRKEKELDLARNKLITIRHAHYQHHKTGDDNPEGTSSF